MAVAVKVEVVKVEVAMVAEVMVAAAREAVVMEVEAMVAEVRVEVDWEAEVMAVEAMGAVRVAAARAVAMAATRSVDHSHRSPCRERTAVPHHPFDVVSQAHRLGTCRSRWPMERRMCSSTTSRRPRFQPHFL